ncbi:hypothetical protein F5051DRAFT_394377 [Lentinula edodes]|nr:hypothetical protein F5051DRAFT_394377 [Lentinula edodes]
MVSSTTRVPLHLSSIMAEKGSRVFGSDRKYTLFKKVTELHSLGIQHGDLFPRNIFIDDEKVLRIVDFHRSMWKYICPGHKNCVELTKLHEALGLPLEEQ